MAAWRFMFFAMRFIWVAEEGSDTEDKAEGRGGACTAVFETVLCAGDGVLGFGYGVEARDDNGGTSIEGKADGNVVVLWDSGLLCQSRVAKQRGPRTYRTQGKVRLLLMHCISCKIYTRYQTSWALETKIICTVVRDSWFPRHKRNAPNRPRAVR